MFTVDKGIPIQRATASARYPLREMEVGDSFVAPVSKRTSVSTRAKLLGDELGRKFITRAVSPTEVRVWRVA